MTEQMLMELFVPGMGISVIGTWILCRVFVKQKETD